jgi:folylpolyglutamate synthase/dihydropteroate synthase
MPLVKLAAAIYAVPVSYGQSVPTALIVDWAEQQGLPVSEYHTAGEGFAAALKSVRYKDPVVVCGSLYLVAELRQELLERGLPVTLEPLDCL